MEIMISMVAFFALIASWFVLPSAPPTAARQQSPAAEPLPSAA